MFPLCWPFMFIIASPTRTLFWIHSRRAFKCLSVNFILELYVHLQSFFILFSYLPFLIYSVIFAQILLRILTRTFLSFVLFLNYLFHCIVIFKFLFILCWTSSLNLLR
jgi:hypothetical protein